jgi:pimeloyl-ACP methyl ester carboxylesterase
MKGAIVSTIACIARRRRTAGVSGDAQAARRSGRETERHMGDSAVGLLDQLPDRWLPDRVQTEGRWRIRLGRATRDVVVSKSGVSIERPKGKVHAEIETDHETWRAMDAGRLSGIEAFVDRRLKVRGSIERALQFEPMFDRPDDGGLRYTIEDVPIGNGVKISALIAGSEEGEPLLLMHGLGATKASWLTVLPQLAARYRVMVIDLPGFGRSSKPIGRYDAAWFCGHVCRFLDSMGVERCHAAGNSMGGKVAMELAMLDPERVMDVMCLCPASAFSDRPMLRLVQLLRPELGVAVGFVPRSRVRKTIESLFSNPGSLDGVWIEAAIDDFTRIWRNPKARGAFFAAARSIYLEEPHGEAGFFTRLELMETPSLFIYGEQDGIITHHFGRKIEQTLPSAEVHVWQDCGHVPQIEHPDRTAEVMLDFMKQAANKRAAS